MLYALLAQATVQAGNPTGQASGSARSDPRILIDPSKSPGVSLQQSNSPTQVGIAANPSHGPVAQSLNHMTPQTGNEAIDGALKTFFTSVGHMTETLVGSLPNVLIALLVVIVTGVAVSLVGRFFGNLLTRMRFRESLRDLFVLLLRIGVWFIGLAIAAGIIFPGLGMGQLVATAGLASIAVGFAFKDIFENFFAGILILWRFPFENGDFIQVEEIVGKVEEIEIRMTKIRQTNGQLTLIPNATIYKSVLHVLTNYKSRRLSITAGIARGEDVGQGRAVIQRVVAECPSVHHDRPIEVFAHGFGASSIDFEVTWWTNPTPLDHRRSRDEVVEAIKRGLDDAGIEIPYPYRTLVFSRNEPDIINAVSGLSSASNDGDD